MNRTVYRNLFISKQLMYLFFIVMTCLCTWSPEVLATAIVDWQSGHNYLEGDIVRYDGRLYITVHANPGYDPVISHWFWDEYEDQNTELPTVYKHGNYGGYAVALDQGDYTLNDLKGLGILNDDISSVRVPDGYVVELYQHNYFKGNKDSYTHDAAHVIHNDDASSIKVFVRDDSDSNDDENTEPQLQVLLQAEDYTAYHDTTAGNTGGAYRNDNVDIEESTDTGGGYNVGWIQNGEWLEYQVNLVPGNYEVSARVASSGGGGSWSLSIDGAQVTDVVYVNDTWGWQNWITQTSSSFYVGSGGHDVRIHINGAMNLNWFLLSPDNDDDTGDDTDDGDTDDDDTDAEWNRANLTNYTSYPDPGSDECLYYNGCTWAGMFAFLSGQQSEEWVMANNIASVHSKDADAYKLKTLRLRQGNKEIDVKVYDMCADSDCNGCCTENSKETGFLIDIEKYTMDRFGSGSGIVEWRCLDCND